MEHPSDEVLKRFANGKAPRQEVRAVVAHLLKGCRHCQEKIKAFLEPHLTRTLHEADGTEPGPRPPVPGSPPGRPPGRKPWRGT